MARSHVALWWPTSWPRWQLRHEIFSAPEGRAYQAIYSALELFIAERLFCSAAGPAVSDPRSEAVCQLAAPATASGWSGAV
jgi:hypothetical protein